MQGVAVLVVAAVLTVVPLGGTRATTAEVERLMSQAKAGDAQAQTLIGLILEEAGDHPSALAWYRKGADGMDTTAMYMLGRLYEKGVDGVIERNLTIALELWKKSANLGFAQAQKKLGWVFAEGAGVPQDNREAVKWLLKAAQQNDAEAQYALGVLHTRKGETGDPLRAHMWHNIAAGNGHEKSKEQRTVIEKYLTSALVAEAQAMARRCVNSQYMQC
jgi:TPR repeat protein